MNSGRKEGMNPKEGLKAFARNPLVQRGAIIAPLLLGPACARPADVIIEVDAAKGNFTNIPVQKGDKLRFEAEGKWCMGGSECGGPDGIRPATSAENVEVPGEKIGTLVGIVHPIQQLNQPRSEIEGTFIFSVGSKREVVVERNGTLGFGMNDVKGGYADNSGKVQVKIFREQTGPGQQGRETPNTTPPQVRETTQPTQAPIVRPTEILKPADQIVLTTLTNWKSLLSQQEPRRDIIGDKTKLLSFEERQAGEITATWSTVTVLARSEFIKQVEIKDIKTMNTPLGLQPTDPANNISLRAEIQVRYFWRERVVSSGLHPTGSSWTDWKQGFDPFNCETRAGVPTCSASGNSSREATVPSFGSIGDVIFAYPGSRK